MTGGVKLRRCAFKRGRGNTRASHQVSETKLTARLPSGLAKEETCLRFGTDVERASVRDRRGSVVGSQFVGGE